MLLYLFPIKNINCFIYCSCMIIIILSWRSVNVFPICSLSLVFFFKSNNCGMKCRIQWVNLEFPTSFVIIGKIIIKILCFVNSIFNFKSFFSCNVWIILCNALIYFIIHLIGCVIFNYNLYVFHHFISFLSWNILFLNFKLIIFKFMNYILVFNIEAR